jgi:membrane protease subunit (stomatin/prohibitin family)
METEKLTSFDNRPSISALQTVEQEIISLLEIANQTCVELSQVRPNQQILSSLSSRYLNLVKKIKESLSTQIQRLGAEVPYQNTIFGLKKDAEICHMQVEIIHERLREMLSLFDEGGMVGENSEHSARA